MKSRPCRDYINCNLNIKRAEKKRERSECRYSWVVCKYDTLESCYLFASKRYPHRCGVAMERCQFLLIAK